MGPGDSPFASIAMQKLTGVALIYNYLCNKEGKSVKLMEGGKQSKTGLFWLSLLECSQFNE